MYFDNNNLIDVLENVKSFQIYKQGEVEVVDEECKIVEIKNRLYNLFSQSYLIPAIGVSFHDETIEELNKEEWLRINFNKELIKNDLPFNSLLIRLEKTSGFNAIRLYNGKFEGRCLYVNLNEEVDLKELIK